MSRPKLLDLFSCAGGAARGYVEAGFDVTGVDCKPQPHYLLSGAFAFIEADAFDYLAAHGHEFDAIHASPPCQAYSKTAARWQSRESHPDLLAQTRDALTVIGKPWVIENVDGAPLGCAVMLCGTMFGLKVFRHRWFEASFLLLAPSHEKHRGSTAARSDKTGKGYRGGRNGYVTVAGRTCSPSLAAAAMGIDWMSMKELSQAIPPAYASFIGKQLREAIAV